MYKNSFISSIKQKKNHKKISLSQIKKQCEDTDDVSSKTGAKIYFVLLLTDRLKQLNLFLAF